MSQRFRENLEKEKPLVTSHIADTHGDFVKRSVLETRVVVKYIESKENQADILTKPLPIQSYSYLREQIL